MWVCLWIAVGVSTTVLSQHTSTLVQQTGAGFEWGWQLAPVGQRATAGHYYVKLPESEQRVVYAADGSGYHGATHYNSSTHSSQFALGERAIQLHANQGGFQLPQPVAVQSNPPVDIYLLQQHLQSPIIPPQPFSIATSASNTLQLPNYFYKRLTPLYNIQTQHPVKNNEKSDKNVSSKPLKKEAHTEQTFVTPIVQVFKDVNCSDDKHAAEELESDVKKSKELFAEVPSYDLKNVNGNFGAKKNPYTYRGEVSFKVETPRPNARNERYYHTAESSTMRPVYYESSTLPAYNATQEGINRLVASTQDLISNEDLLRINNAIEHHLRDQNDDLIKPRPRFSARTQNRNNDETLHVSPTTVTVRARIANILRGEIEEKDNNPVSEKVLQSDSKHYTFSSPIVVAETPDNSFEKQIFNNVVSTVVPYLENGYEVVDIKNSPEQAAYTSKNKDGSSEEDFVNVTPRPIGSNYLAPITVALRLLNSNDTDAFNYIEDHEVADSELVSDTVERPNEGTTVVEVQESIPLEITHINEVEYHQKYMDEGRGFNDNHNNNAFEFAKSLYNNYVQSLRSSKKMQDNMNAILLYNVETTNSDENNDSREHNSSNESKEQLEANENIQSQVEIRPNGENNQRSEQIYYSGDDYSNSNDQRIIQPIIIEKEVPVTKFVDRYIEKQVPYPETVTVPVPVDRPVPYPVEVEKVVEKPVPVTKYVDKPYPVEVPRPYPVEVKVPYPVHQKVYVDRPVHVPFPVEKVVEKQIVHPVPVPTPVGVPVEVPVPVEQKVLYPFPVDRPVPVPVEVEKPVQMVIHEEVPVPYPVEKRVPYPVPYETKVPVPYPVEKRVPVPVERIVEKPVTVTKVVEKPVHIQVPVPHPVPVHVHHPYPVEKIVEKKVPYPVHVDRIVEKKVNVPYPVEKIVEKIVEKPVVVTKYVNKPYPVEVKVPYPVEKIVEKKVPYPVHVPVEVKVPYQKPDSYQVAYRYGYRPDAEESRNTLQYQLVDQEQLKNLRYQNLKAQYEQYLKDHHKQKKNQQPVPVQSNHWGNHYASSYQYINTSQDSRQQDWRNNPAYSNYIDYVTNTQSKNHNAQSQNRGQNAYNAEQNDGHSNRGQSNGYTSQSQQQLYPSRSQQYSSQSQQYPSQSQQYPGQNQQQHASQSQNQDQYNSQSQIHNNWDKSKNYLLELKVRRTDRVPKVTLEYGFKPPLIPSTEIDLDGMPINKSE